jgi:hypothetical protein
MLSILPNEEISRQINSGKLASSGNMRQEGGGGEQEQKRPYSS